MVIAACYLLFANGARLSAILRILQNESYALSRARIASGCAGAPRRPCRHRTVFWTLMRSTITPLRCDSTRYAPVGWKLHDDTSTLLIATAAGVRARAPVSPGSHGAVNRTFFVPACSNIAQSCGACCTTVDWVHEDNPSPDMCATSTGFAADRPRAPLLHHTV